MLSVAIRGERGGYNPIVRVTTVPLSVAIRGERGGYNAACQMTSRSWSVAIRGERGGYNGAKPKGAKAPLGFAALKRWFYKISIQNCHDTHAHFWGLDTATMLCK